MTFDNNQSEIVPKKYKILISEDQIQNRIEELGKQIVEDFKDKKPILIGVLNGGFIFLADLIRYINIDLDPVRLCEVLS